MRVFLKVNLNEFAAPEFILAKTSSGVDICSSLVVGFKDERIRIGGISREQSITEPRTNNQGSRSGEGRRIPRVI